ncbi:hypothetical protein DL96DRAFT_1610641 [Flagelloscypha sp. PMI_526]|nr:hypothetical protein DL96DRAFT_1610641 [Flagelloscypha sp. PMI_526]
MATFDILSAATETIETEPRLPLDIFQAIVAVCDHHTLMDLSLVSSHLHSMVQLEIFRALDLSNSSLSYVRSLRIQNSLSPFEEIIFKLLFTLRQYERLEKLILPAWALEAQPSPLTIPSLRWVGLTGINILRGGRWTPTAAIQLLTNPLVRSIEFVEREVLLIPLPYEKPNAPPPPYLQLPPLEELRILGNGSRNLDSWKNFIRFDTITKLLVPAKFQNHILRRFPSENKLAILTVDHHSANDFRPLKDMEARFPYLHELEYLRLPETELQNAFSSAASLMWPASLTISFNIKLSYPPDEFKIENEALWEELATQVTSRCGSPGLKVVVKILSHIDESMMLKLENRLSEILSLNHENVEVWIGRGAQAYVQPISSGIFWHRLSTRYLQRSSSEIR